MSGYNGRGYSSYNGQYNGPRLHEYDYPRWAYVLAYLLIIVVSLVGNGLFLLVVKKNQHLRRTSHFLLATLAVRDILVTLLVVPFVISQAVNLMRWTSGEALCKLFSFMNYGTLATHSFILVFLLLFLYFWYRKNEAYMTEDGQTVVRQTRMHNWSIPLAWVLGLGLAIPAGALARNSGSVLTGTETCALWNGRGNADASYWVQLNAVVVAFLLCLVILVFPVIALVMQLCGARLPRLDPPHSRTAVTAVALVVVFLATRAPYEIFMMLKLFHQSSMGLKVNTGWNTPYAMTSFESDVVIDCIVYSACLIHPLLYFLINPEYRKGAVVVWNDLYCNKDEAQRQREEEAKRQRRPQHQRQYPAAGPPHTGGGKRNRLPANARANQEQLLPQRQPQIVGPGGPQGQPQQPYGQPQGAPFQQTYHLSYPQQPQPQPAPMPNHQLQPDQHFLDSSFDSRMTTPALPPVFKYGKFEYFDTSRVEPRIGYSPEKTPPKTPEIPHFREKPFQPAIQEVMRDIEMVDMSGQPFLPQAPAPAPAPAPISPEPAKPEEFKLEHLEGSPGTQLRRGRMRPEDLDESVEILQESPGGRNRRRATQESQPL